MADNTTPVRWAGRNAADTGAGLSHDAREPDEQAEHSNELIDNARTHRNVTLVNDGAGGLRPGTKAEMREMIDAKVESCQNFTMRKDKKTGELKKVFRSPRNDASVAVEAVLALDPEVVGYVASGYYPQLDEDGDAILDDDGNEKMEWHDGMTDEQVDQAVEWLLVEHRALARHFGEDNAVGLTIHLDETRIHAHAWYVPKTPAGQLNYAAFFSDDPERKAKTKTEAATHYSALHDDIRADLREAGYDASDERFAAGRKHLSPAVHKREMARRARAKAQVRQAEDRVREVKSFLTDELPVIRDRAVAEGREQGLAEAAEELARDRADLVRDQEQAQAARDRAVADAQAARELLEQAQVAPGGSAVDEKAFVYRHGLGEKCQAWVAKEKARRAHLSAAAARIETSTSPSGYELS